MSREWEHHFEELEPATKRVVLRYLDVLPSKIPKFLNEESIQKGWQDIGVFPFDQRLIFQKNAGYLLRLDDHEKAEIDRAMPQMIREYMELGTGLVPDNIIFRNVGHIIGRPYRGSTEQMEKEVKDKDISIPENPLYYDQVPKIGIVSELTEQAFHLQRAAKISSATQSARMKLQSALNQKKEDEKRAKDEAKAYRKERADGLKQARLMGLKPKSKAVPKDDESNFCISCSVKYEESQTWSQCEHCGIRNVCEREDCKGLLHMHERRCQQTMKENGKRLDEEKKAAEDRMLGDFESLQQAQGHASSSSSKGNNSKSFSLPQIGQDKAGTKSVPKHRKNSKSNNGGKSAGSAPTGESGSLPEVNKRNKK